MIASLVQRKGVRQLVKFCIVGASSTVVDSSIKFFLNEHYRQLFPWWAISTIAFCFGLTNGFFWNRHLTFRAKSYATARAQYIKFAASNAVGLLLNLIITKMFLMLFTGQVVHEVNPDTNTLLRAGWCAIPFVAIWNFSAAKYWTFREPKEAVGPTVSDESTQPYRANI